MAVQAQQYSENLGLYLSGSQELMGSSGGFYDFNLSPPPQQQQQQQQQLQQQQMIQNLQRNQNPGQVVSPPSMAFSQSLVAHLEKQRQEIDRYIALQNESLRSALQEQRKQQLSVLLRGLESKTHSLMRQKDEDLAKATGKTMELEACLRKIEMENQTWQRVAKESEAMAISLNNAIEQVREKVGYFSSEVGDSESCCDLSNGHELNRGTKRWLCKACNSRSSCVLFLPCRHLCLCKSCEAFLGSCPVCKSVKKGCIEVFMV